MDTTTSLLACPARYYTWYQAGGLCVSDGLFIIPTNSAIVGLLALWYFILIVKFFPFIIFSFSFSYPPYTLEHNLVSVEMDSVLLVIYLWHQKENIQGVKN